jgi:DNA-binding transcriptional regulator YhcF (GntR family)
VEQLLSLPEPSRILETIAGRTKGDAGITARELGKLLNVRDEFIRKHARNGDLSERGSSAEKIPQDSAVRIVTGYLPRILKWKSVADFAEELGIHRNTVESLIRQASQKEALRISLDQKLYISPAGERFVREKKQLLDSLESREPLADFARRLRLKLNHLTAFFSSRGIALDADIRGRARLTQEQKEMFITWRDSVLERRKHDTMIIDGKPHISIVRLAEEKAAIFAPQGTSRYHKIKEREMGSFRHSGKQGGFRKKTDRGTYLPEEQAMLLFSSVTLAEASRLVGVPISVVKRWARHNTSLVAPAVPGRRARGLSIPALIDHARHSYDTEPLLAPREEVPAIIASSEIGHLAKRLGTSFSRVLRVLPVGEADQALLQRRVGMIPRALCQDVVSLLRDEPIEVDVRPLTPSAMAAARANASRIGISTEELLALALSPERAHECATLPREIPAPLYLNLIRLGSVSASSFDMYPIAPARHLAEIMDKWSTREKIPLKTALGLARVDEGEHAKILKRDGFVSGAAAVRLLKFSRMSAEEFQKKTSVSERQFRSVIKKRALELGVRWKDLTHALPIDGRSEKSLLSKEGILSVACVDSLKGVLATSGVDFLRALEPESALYSATSLRASVEEVAAARRVAPERLYSFMAQFFAPSVKMPHSYPELVKEATLKRAPTIFPVKVGLFLAMIRSPRVRVHSYGVSTFTPDPGDIMVNQSLKDFGTILSIHNTEGGRTALVALIGRKSSLSFRVP